MTRRSEPRPGCAYCKGSGIISVSKDPDEVIDCVCTDPPEPGLEERVSAYAAELGVDLLPWRVDVAVRLLSGDTFMMPWGRRQGRRTVMRIVDGVRNG